METGFIHTKFCSSFFSSISQSLKTFVFFILLFCGTFIYSQWFHTHSLLNKLGNQNQTFSPNWIKNPQTMRDSNSNSNPMKPNHTLTCPTKVNPTNITCATNPSTTSPHPTLPQTTCPNYFRWIHEDLRPWATNGITKETLESSKIHAAFRLIVIDGRAYVHHYHKVFQTRDTFTIWGIVQLLRRYPGRIPDIDLMFNCEDMPVVQATKSYVSSSPPPLFRYCKDESTVDIVFPDWSFWGWPEVNIRSWAVLMEEISEASERRKWLKREPYAYWKGNPDVAEARIDLMKCNLTKEMDWKARFFKVNWENEERLGFSSSNLATQCNYRYKVYVDGRAWSVSEKYILGCDSPTLYVESKFQNFINRGLRPGRHYWPIRQEGKCWAIKQAVNWGNTHTQEVEGIGKAGSGFIKEEVKMTHIYDYMLHLLTEYSKLLTYKPTKPEEAIEVCLESMACPFQGKVREFLLESTEMEASNSEPCSLPPPFTTQELTELLHEKTIDGTNKVVETLIKNSSGKRVGVVGESLSFLLSMILFFFFCFC